MHYCQHVIGIYTTENAILCNSHIDSIRTIGQLISADIYQTQYQHQQTVFRGLWLLDARRRPGTGQRGAQNVLGRLMLCRHALIVRARCILLLLLACGG